MHHDNTASPLDPDIRLARLALVIADARRCLQDCDHEEALDALVFARSSLAIAITDITKEARHG